MKLKRYRDAIVGCVTLMVSVFYLYYTQQIKTRPKLTPAYANARIIPWLLGIALAILSVMLIVQGVRKAKKQDAEENGEKIGGIGILPGIGGGTSNVLAYTVAKNYDKHPEEFGTGRIDGVVASETANNVTICGAMVPLLTLGIPGDTTTAMLLGALTLHGLTPGPLLFQNQANVVYGIFAAMLIASAIMLFMEFFGLRVFVKLLSIPKYILLPCVFVLCTIGAYALKNNMSQVIACLIFGTLGYAFKKFAG